MSHELEPHARIASHLNMLGILQRNGLSAGITVKGEAFTLGYIGQITEIKDAGMASAVKLNVQHAVAIFVTQASLDVVSLFDALREARETVEPSADSLSALSADLELAHSIEASSAQGPIELMLHDQVGTLHTISLDSIAHILGIGRN